jgi:hypothetical protein
VKFIIYIKVKCMIAIAQEEEGKNEGTRCKVFKLM